MESFLISPADFVAPTSLGNQAQQCRRGVASRALGPRSCDTAVVEIDREVRRVIVGDLVSLALGAVELRQPSPQLLAERQARLGCVEPVAIASDQRLEPARRSPPGPGP